MSVHRLFPVKPPADDVDQLLRANLTAAIATLRQLAQHRKEAGAAMFAEAAEIERHADHLQSVLDGKGEAT